MGGSSIYAQAIGSEKCESLIITKVQGRYDCDTFFPEYEHEWEFFRVVQSGANYKIVEYRKKPKESHESN